MIEHPRELAVAFAQAWNRSDASAIAALFTEDADYVGALGLWWTNRSQIEAALGYGFRQTLAGSSIVLEKVVTRMIGESAAVVHASWVMQGRATGAGERRVRSRGVISFVGVRDQRNAWFAVSAHSTDVGAAAATWAATAAGQREPGRL